MVFACLALDLYDIKNKNKNNLTEVSVILAPCHWQLKLFLTDTFARVESTCVERTDSLLLSPARSNPGPVPSTCKPPRRSSVWKQRGQSLLHSPQSTGRRRQDPTPHATRNNPSASCAAATTCSSEPVACQAWEAPLLACLGPVQLGSLWGESGGQGARLGELLFL